MLSHLLEDPDYANFYRAESGTSFIILDNSAHERTTGNPVKELVAQAREIQASEIVIPDKLFDGKATLIQARDSFHWLANAKSKSYMSSDWRWMVVPQGQTWEEYEWCFRQLLKLCRAWENQLGHCWGGWTIGVSKDYEMFEGGLYRIVSELLEPLHTNDPSIQFHLLGWGRDLWALGEIAQDFDWVRSVDSAKPYVYAAAGVALYPLANYPAYPKRQPNYFHTPLQWNQRSTVDQNIWTFNRLARGEVKYGAQSSSSR